MDTRFRISESAQSCKTYFREYLESPCPGATRIAKDQLARFNLWASNIAVFAPDSHASLDRRLSDSCHDGIRQMILRLLDVIGKDLELAKRFAGNPPMEMHFETKSDSTDFDSDSSISESSSSSNSLLMDLESGPYLRPASLKPLLSVRRAISQLHLISSAIRKASQRDHDEKASRYEEEDPQERKATLDFANFARGITKARHSAASNDLLDRLSQTMISRRRKLRYSRRRREKQILAEKHANAAIPKRPTVQEVTVKHLSKPALESESTHRPTPKSVISFQPSGTEPSKLDPKVFRAPSPSIQASTARTQSRAGFGRLDCPPPPTTEKEHKDVECPYCFSILSPKMLSGKRWISHVKPDLEAYVCVFDNCSQPLKLYKKCEEWLQHLQLFHGSVKYHCNATKHGPLVFDSDGEYNHHMRQVHSGTFTEAQLPTLVSDSAQPVAEIFHTCPLCDGVPEDVVGSDDMNLLELSQCLQGHIEKHLISLATLSLIWQPLDYSDTPSISEGSSNVALWSTGSVIARNELTNTVSLDFIDRGRVDIIPDPEIDENHAKQAYVVPIDWNEYQIGLTKPQPNVQDHTIASFASHLRKQQQERNTESFRNQSPSSTEDPSLEYSFQPCSYCVDILKIMRNVLNLSTESSAKGIVFEHHATVSILKKSAQDGCSLCGVFSNELDLSPIEKDDIVKYSLSLVWHEREQTRILVLESAQEEIWLELYCDRDSSLEKCNWTSSRNINESPVCDQSIGLVREWLDSCVSTHENCHSLSEEPALPTRVLDVGTTGDATDLRLLLSKGLQGRYAAASFCWGKIGILRTTQAVLNALVVRIPLEQLSQTFIDFITITRELGLRYIWIDALCIVQDSYEDWEKEAALLPHYFQNSFVNIVAASASDASQGFLASRSSSPLFTFHVHIPGDPRGGVLHLRKYLGLQDPVSAEPISSRGWVFQEQLLSPRNLYYTSREMTWECQQTAHRESFDASVSSYSPRLEIKKFIGEINTKTGNEADGPQEQEILDLWDSLVTMYSDKKVTYAPDRLLALESLARVFHKVLQDDYMAGMWRSGFPESMAWYRSGIHDSSKETHHIYIAPSWSWASDFGSTAYFFTERKNIRTLKIGTPLPKLLPAKFLGWSCRSSSDGGPLMPHSGRIVEASITLEAEYFMISTSNCKLPIIFDNTSEKDLWDLGTAFTCISLQSSFEKTAGWRYATLILAAKDLPSIFYRVGLLGFYEREWPNLPETVRGKFKIV